MTLTTSQLHQRRHRWLETANKTLLGLPRKNALALPLAVHLWTAWNPARDPFWSNEKTALALGLASDGATESEMNSAVRKLQKAMHVLRDSNVVRDNGRSRSGTVHRALWMPDEDAPVNPTTWRGGALRGDSPVTQTSKNTHNEPRQEPSKEVREDPWKEAAKELQEDNAKEPFNEPSPIKFTDAQAIRLKAEADKLDASGYSEEAWDVECQALAAQSTADAFAERLANVPSFD